MPRLHFIAITVILAALVLGCENWRGGEDKSAQTNSKTVKPSHDTTPAPTAAGRSLYDRLGGEPAIRAVVNDFVDRSAPDPKVNFTRKGTPKEWQATPESVRQLKDRLTEFVAQAAGGPQKYTGKDMRTVHTGMRITDAEFDALAGHLKASLQKFNVPQREQDELLAVVGSTRKDIVGL